VTGRLPHNGQKGEDGRFDEYERAKGILISTMTGERRDRWFSIRSESLRARKDRTFPIPEREGKRGGMENIKKGEGGPGKNSFSFPFVELRVEEKVSPGFFSEEGEGVELLSGQRGGKKPSLAFSFFYRKRERRQFFSGRLEKREKGRWPSSLRECGRGGVPLVVRERSDLLESM